MPITLEKLFSRTVNVSFPFMGETVHVAFAPDRVTGEMMEFADKLEADSEHETEELAELREKAAAATKEADALGAEQDPDQARIEELREAAATAIAEVQQREIKLDQAGKKAVRRMLAEVLVSWDVLDGKRQVGTDLEALNKLPDLFLTTTFLSLSNENQPDPQKAPPSNEPSNTGKGSARSQPGTSSSRELVPSVSHRSSSTNGRPARGSTPSGAGGR